MHLNSVVCWKLLVGGYANRAVVGAVDVRVDNSLTLKRGGNKVRK